MASRYGASRIPVREALQLLHAQGLVRVALNRGAFVAALDAAEVDEIFDLRVLLESYLLRAAVPRHGSRSIARLEAIQQDLEHEDTRAGWLQGDRLFHEALYEPAGKQSAVPSSWPPCATRWSAMPSPGSAPAPAEPNGNASTGN